MDFRVKRPTVVISRIPVRPVSVEAPGRARPQALLPLLDEQQCDSVDALGTDLREAVLSELVLVKSEALHAMGDLTKWTQPRQVERTLAAALDQRLVLTMGAGGRPVEQALGPLECYHVLSAGGNTLAQMVELPFDHVFFLVRRGPFCANGSAVPSMRGGSELSIVGHSQSGARETLAG
ncbi:unnamed protein product [Boreogadus saida]